MVKNINGLTSRFRWLWLSIGTALMVFVPAQTTFFFAAWLAPIFLLRFVRTTRILIALPVLLVAIFLAMLIAFRNGFMPLTDLDFYLTVAGIAVAYTVVFGIDRLLWKRFKGVASTLVFPLASTTVSFLATLGNPVGTAGSEAYSQTETSLLQIVSMTGIWGLVFLMAWFGSVVNAVWEYGFDIRKTRKVIGLYAAVLFAVLIFGATRLAFYSTPTSTVRVAMIAPDRALHDQSKVIKLTTADEREASRARLVPLVNDLFTRTEIEAMAGAKIIVWSEGTARILKEDESVFLDRARTLAKERRLYLQVGVTAFLDTDSSPKNENRAIMITPDGSIAWDYHKSKITPGDAEKPGPGKIPSIGTPYGKLATIICQDDLFPDLVRQTSTMGVDILLVPSSDWESVAEAHARMSTLRGVENGTAIVRPTRQGTSFATDSMGRILAYKSDYFIGSNQTVVANVPTHAHMKTVYSYIGDSIAYASIAGLVVLGGWAAIRRFTNRDK